jgi:hypothetical protein
MSTLETGRERGATYSNITISGEARRHLGSNYANTIVNNYNGMTNSFHLKKVMLTSVLLQETTLRMRSGVFGRSALSARVMRRRKTQIHHESQTPVYGSWIMCDSVIGGISQHLACSKLQ